MSQAGRVLTLILSAAFTGLMGAAFVTRYWLWRSCFTENGEGRCWDSVGQMVYVENAGWI